MPKILLVDDNEENQDMLSRRLQRRGYEMILAQDGVQAVALARSEMPDLILMDMNMPLMDGWEATKLLRSEPATQSLAIIALTAHAMTGDRTKALEAGCDDYHSKPVDLPRLLAQIETLLKKPKAGE
jgi:CheY-like chemotaxis protein